MGKVTNTKGSFQKKLAEMKKKIKQTNQDANACDTGTYLAELSQYSKMRCLFFFSKIAIEYTWGSRPRGSC